MFHFLESVFVSRGLLCGRIVRPLLPQLVLVLFGHGREIRDLVFPLRLSLERALGTGFVRVVLRHGLGQPLARVGGQVVGIHLKKIK